MPRVRTHPGEILKEDFLVPLNMSARTLADKIGVAPNRLTEVIKGTRAVTPDTALRLGRYFDTSANFWLNLQLAHDLSKAESNGDYQKIIPRKLEEPIKNSP